jgi:superfamily II DNA or RNA helicase
MVDRQEIYKTYQVGTPYYGFARGNLQKILNLFGDYEIEDRRAIVPLGYGLEMLEELEDGTIQANDSRWPEQTAALAAWIRQGFGIMKAPAGWGKTVWSWRLISALKQRTLLLAHTTGLRDQFIARGYKHTNLKDLERIHGKLAGSYDSYGDQLYPITDSTIQSWYSVTQKTRLADLQNQFGLILVDEGHHASALSYARIILELNPMFLASITATPYRKDGTHVLTFDVVGPVVVEAHGEQLPCEVEYVRTSLEIDPAIANHYYAGPWNYIMKQLIKNKERNELVIDKVHADVRAGHKVLVLSDRNNHVEWIHQQLTAIGCRSAIILGYTWNREEIKQKMIHGDLDVIVSGKVFNEGEDVPPLSALHLVTPNSNEALTEQRAGRIRRPWPGKMPPVIRDYLDFGHSMLFAAKNTRERVYVRLNFKLPTPVKRTTADVGLAMWDPRKGQA